MPVMMDVQRDVAAKQVRDLERDQMHPYYRDKPMGDSVVLGGFGEFLLG